MPIEISKQETVEAIASIKRFAREELEVELNELQGGFLFKFFLEEIAPIAYNKGVKDAEDFLRAQMEDLAGACYEAPMTFWSKKKAK